MRGWQAKRFEKGHIHWGQCEKSVRRAVGFWRPPRITFVFPFDLSASEQNAFRTRLQKKFPEVRLDWWGWEEIQRRLRDTDEGRRAAAWLFENPAATKEEMLVAMAAGGPLQDARDAAERGTVIQKFLNRAPAPVHRTLW